MTQQEKPTILAVDDEPSNLELLAKALSDEYRVLLATDPEEAIRLAETQRPDLILMDVMMPKMNGYEVCRHLKGSPAMASIPVIFVTAMGEEQYETVGFDVGGVDYIAKPIRPFVLAARVRTHIDLKRKTDFLKDLSAHDGLTGLPNRRSFDETLEREWRRSLRSGSCLALIMMDIDFFKPYNDNYGHAAGDICLKQVAKLMDDVIERSTDLLARYGGEEFVCVLPETDINGAKSIGEKLRQAVADAEIEHAHSKVADFVTISMGVASLIPDMSQRPEALLKMADSKLYEAKESGRNRVAG
ncbi:MAG: PleD family two-component system response regulator [Magnetococcales bacterium]|nr:PleD family two-component system response regulator [Magnetococcales bacterium]